MDKKPTKAGATKPKKRINFKVVEPKTKPKPKMEVPKKKKNIKFIVKKKEEPKKKKNIKFIVKKKEEPKPKPVSELQRVAGLTKEQANKMNPAELFSKLPVELTNKIGTLALADRTLPSFNELKRLSPQNLLEKFIKIKEEPEMKGQFKDMPFKKTTESLLKSIGNKFGRLPKLQDFNMRGGFTTDITPKYKGGDVQLYKILEKKFGDNFGASVKEELLKRLGDNMRLPKDKAIEKIKGIKKGIAEQKKSNERFALLDRARDVVDKRIKNILDSGKEKDIHYHASGRDKKRYLRDYNRFMNEYFEYASPTDKKIFEENKNSFLYGKQWFE
jgi:hypothetical protein